MCGPSGRTSVRRQVRHLLWTSDGSDLTSEPKWDGSELVVRARNPVKMTSMDRVTPPKNWIFTQFISTVRLFYLSFIFTCLRSHLLFELHFIIWLFFLKLTNEAWGLRIEDWGRRKRRSEFGERWNLTRLSIEQQMKFAGEIYYLAQINTIKLNKNKSSKLFEFLERKFLTLKRKFASLERSQSKQCCACLSWEREREIQLLKLEIKSNQCQVR